tara:strand:- start:126 stop:362 length:237 start_codon:yes stop_codon:yes gene_type:complete
MARHIKSDQLTSDVLSSEILGVDGGFGNSRIIDKNQIVPENYNVVLFVTKFHPSITIASGIDYTISAGADVVIHNISH